MPSKKKFLNNMKGVFPRSDAHEMSQKDRKRHRQSDKIRRRMNEPINKYFGAEFEGSVTFTN
jgi:hypothetical protein